MKILMPATHYYPVIGGIETWTKNIAEGLADKAEVFVVTGRVHPVKSSEAGAKQFNRVKIYRTSLFSLNNLSHSPLIYTLSLLPFVFVKSLSLIKKEKIDLLHCQGFLSSLVGFSLSMFTGVPYIVTVQRLEGKRNLFKWWIYRRAVTCIVASGAIKKIFEEMGVKNVEVIPNGIDLEKFKNLQRQPHDGFVIITVARLEKVKGVEYLIRAFARLLNTRCLTTKLVIIGDGSERKNLERLVEELNLKEKVNRAHNLCASVKFLGEIPNEKIPEYLTVADCFVLPSLKEGFGIVLLEAMAVGLPVIGTKVGGILDIIEDGKTGILVEPKNPQAIAGAIQGVYSGRKFDKANLEKYSWQNIAERVYKIYKNLAL